MDSEKYNPLKSLISSLPAYIDGKKYYFEYLGHLVYGKKLLIEMKQNNLPK